MTTHEHGDQRQQKRSPVEQRNLDPEGNVLSAKQEDRRHPWESALNGDELASMPYLAPGAELKAGQSYLDLNQLNGGPFTPAERRTVQDGDRIVAQSDIDPPLWRRLVGEG
jgi:hypothetical protein